MPLTPTQLATYAQDGYLILEDCLTPAECDELTAEVERVLAEARAAHLTGGGQPDDFLPSGVLVGLAVASPLFRAYTRHPAFVEPLEAIWGPQVGFLSDKVVFKNDTVGFGSPWHQDWPYWKGSHKVSLWVALDPATRENGCLLVLPGSHHAALDHDQIAAREGFGNRLDLRDHGIDTEPVAAELRRGSAVLFHDLTLHASLPNLNGQPRRALITTYRSLAEPDLEYSWAQAAERVSAGG